MKIIKNITEGLSGIAFPHVCVCCGSARLQYGRQLCSFCVEERFQDANVDNNRVSSDSLLPEGIIAQHALWQFDQGGDLQELLHKLKYERLTTIGLDLGRRLGQRIAEHPYLAGLLANNPSVVVPVPLHHRKQRSRGFNQAAKIAAGFQQIWNDIPICEVSDIKRTKSTRSQTGFSLQQRIKNMDNAFEVCNSKTFRRKVNIILDDVFTTGATTFELADTLLSAEADSIIILTVAQA